MSLSSSAVSESRPVSVLQRMRRMLRSGDEKLLNLHDYTNTIDKSKWIETVVDPRIASIIYPRALLPPPRRISRKSPPLLPQE